VDYYSYEKEEESKMFIDRRLGEVEDDIFYTEQVMRDEEFYARIMLSQPISDYEKERWQTGIGIFDEAGIGSINSNLLFGTSTNSLLAGFSSENWPTLAILGIGLLVAMRSGKKGVHKRKTKRR